MTEATEFEPRGDVAPSAKDDGSPFTRGFPDDPELNTLVAAFEQGRYDVVRERAPKLAQATKDPEVARAALQLRERLEADPLAVRLLLGALVLLVVLTSWAYLAHQH